MKFGKASIEITAYLEPLKKALNKARSAVGKAAKGMGRLFASTFNQAIRSAKWVALGLVGIGIASAKMASDAQESENLFSVSMGKMSDSARAWSKSLSKALNLNQYEIRENVAMINVMLNSMGLSEKAAYDMSKGITKLAYDMASFYNLNTEDAFQKLRAGIVGETEPLRRLGIVITENAVKAQAFKMGIASLGSELTEKQKILARYSLIMASTEKAQGDMARTVNDTSNVFKQLSAKVKESSILFGTGLLNGVTKAGIGLRDFFADNEKNFTKWGEIAGEELTKAVDLFKNIANRISKAFKESGWQGVFDEVKNVGTQIGTILGNAIVDSLGPIIREGIMQLLGIGVKRWLESMVKEGLNYMSTQTRNYSLEYDLNQQNNPTNKFDRFFGVDKPNTKGLGVIHYTEEGRPFMWNDNRPGSISK